MTFAVRKLPALAITGFVGISSSVSFGQDAATATAEFAGNLHESHAAKTLSDAFTKGDIEAWKTLALEYGPRAIGLLLVMIVSYMVATFLGRVIGGIVSQKVDLTFGRFMTKAIRNILMLLVCLGVLSYFKVDVTGVAAIMAALGFAVGMALQGTLSNFAAGIMLLVFRPFKVDDYIVVAGTEGTVEEIDLFTTRLNSLDNRHLIIPNGEIFGNSLENYSRNEFRRVDVNVGADYSADLDKTRLVLQNAIANIPGSVPSPAPQVYLCELGASSVDWQLRVWCQPKHYWDVREHMTVVAKKALDANGIGIPFPQMDVHVVGKVLAKAA